MTIWGPFWTFLTILLIFSPTVHSFRDKNLFLLIWSLVLLYHETLLIAFFRYVDFDHAMAFLRYFRVLFGYFCPWTSYRWHILTQQIICFKIWSLELYQDIFYAFFIFDHIWGWGWVLAYGYLRQEIFAPGAVLRSSALCLFWLCSFTLASF